MGDAVVHVAIVPVLSGWWGDRGPEPEKGDHDYLPEPERDCHRAAGVDCGDRSGDVLALYLLWFVQRYGSCDQYACAQFRHARDRWGQKSGQRHGASECDVQSGQNTGAGPGRHCDSDLCSG